MMKFLALLFLFQAIDYDANTQTCKATATTGETVVWSGCAEEVVQPPTTPPPSTGGIPQWQVYNPVSVLNVQTLFEIYTATGDDDPNQESLWYHGSEGRLDYVDVSGDWTVTANSISTGFVHPNTNQWQTTLCGLVVWESPGYWEFALAGKRSTTNNTVEYKININGNSKVRDIGADAFPSGYVDLRVSRTGGASPVFEWRETGASQWSIVPIDSMSWFGRVNFSDNVRVGMAAYGTKAFHCSASVFVQ